jgi:hypothetical protein
MPKYWLTGWTEVAIKRTDDSPQAFCQTKHYNRLLAFQIDIAKKDCAQEYGLVVVYDFSSKGR